MRSEPPSGPPADPAPRQAGGPRSGEGDGHDDRSSAIPVDHGERGELTPPSDRRRAAVMAAADVRELLDRPVLRHLAEVARQVRRSIDPRSRRGPGGPA